MALKTWYNNLMKKDLTDLQIPEFTFDPTALVVYGGGGHGKTIIELARSTGCYRVVGIFDDALPAGSIVMDVPVLGNTQALEECYRQGVRLAANAVGGINHPAVRLQVFENLAKAGFACPTLVHPTCQVESSARLAAGVQLLPHCYVGSDSIIGFGSLLNSGVVISHDCHIGACVNLSPGALLAGGVTLEDFVQIGMGVTININLSIGRGAQIGNSAVIKADVPAGAIVHAGEIWPAPAGRQPGRESLV
jgi:acetyltransferase EpsM